MARLNDLPLYKLFLQLNLVAFEVISALPIRNILFLFTRLHVRLLDVFHAGER